jgi:ribosomal protein S18 acetylase RimI-like enzyme
VTRPLAGPSIRRARPEEFNRLREVEIHADSRFETLDIGPFFSDATDDHFDSAALVLAAGDPAVGFICLDMVDGLPHIWQLSVQPNFGRRGIGRALIEAACDWARESGFRGMTLTTFRDVP